MPAKNPTTAIKEELETLRATVKHLAEALETVATTNIAITAEMKDMKHALMALAAGQGQASALSKNQIIINSITTSG